MNALKSVNRLRKSLMKKVTRSMGITYLNEDREPSQRIEIKKILVCRPNHRLGNQLLISPLLQEVAKTLPGARIDLFVKGNISPFLFKNYANVGEIIQLPKKPFKSAWKYLSGWWRIRRKHYDLAINVVNHSSSGKLSTRFAHAKYKFLGDINADIETRYPDHVHMAKYPVYSFRSFISKFGYPKNGDPVPTLDLKLTASEKAEGKIILQNVVQNEKKTICFYTYATGAKRYSVEWWEVFYRRLKKTFPDYNILEILPVENVSQIAFKAPSFYSKDLRAIGSVISNTELFVGADSGMMHLASAAQVPTIGLFKTNNLATYAPYNKKSTGLHICISDTDECIEAIKRILSGV